MGSGQTRTHDNRCGWGSFGTTLVSGFLADTNPQAQEGLGSRLRDPRAKGVHWRQRIERLGAGFPTTPALPFAAICRL